MNAFQKQVVDHVRTMSDEALLDLVKQALTSEHVEPGASPVAVRKQRHRRRTEKVRRDARQRKREADLDKVAKAVAAGKGLAVSEIARQVKMPVSRVSSLLRALKNRGRIYQGGDRRFARYANEQVVADSASEHARSTASGPKKKRLRKR